MKTKHCWRSHSSSPSQHVICTRKHSRCRSHELWPVRNIENSSRGPCHFRQNSGVPLKKHITQTFQRTALPVSKWRAPGFRTRSYIPNPHRCSSCQQFRNNSHKSRKIPTCEICSDTDHTSQSCVYDEDSMTCSRPHASYFACCPFGENEITL